MDHKRLERLEGTSTGSSQRATHEQIKQAIEQKEASRWQSLVNETMKNLKSIHPKLLDQFESFFQKEDPSSTKADEAKIGLDACQTLRKHRGGSSEGDYATLEALAHLIKFSSDAAKTERPDRANFERVHEYLSAKCMLPMTEKQLFHYVLDQRKKQLQRQDVTSQADAPSSSRTGIGYKTEQPSQVSEADRHSDRPRLTGEQAIKELIYAEIERQAIKKWPSLQAAKNTGTLFIEYKYSELRACEKDGRIYITDSETKLEIKSFKIPNSTIVSSRANKKTLHGVHAFQNIIEAYNEHNQSKKPIQFKWFHSLYEPMIYSGEPITNDEGVIKVQKGTYVFDDAANFLSRHYDKGKEYNQLLNYIHGRRKSSPDDWCKITEGEPEQKT